MQNRFGFKDLVLFTLLIVLILVVWLGMTQLDRQWKLIRSVEQQGTEQTRLLASIRRAIEDGIQVIPRDGAGGPTTQDSKRLGDGFARLKEAEAQKDFARGDWLIDNFATKLARVTPLVSQDLYANWVQAKVLESLAYRDPDTLEYVPVLARSWQVKDNSEEWHAYVDPRLKTPLTEAEVLAEGDIPPADKADERKAYIERRLKQGRRPEDVGAEDKCPPAIMMTFQLRKGVTFSDGEPFTADDVVFTYEWTMNPKVNAPRDRAYLRKIKKVEKKSDYEVVFTFNEPYFQSFTLASEMQILPKHFYSKFAEEDFNQNPGLLMGTGAYKMPTPAGWRPGQKTELVRNETYWGEPPTFNRIVFLEVEEEAAEETMFKNGELDVFATQPEQYNKLLKDPKVTARANNFDFESPMLGFSYIAWNQKRAGANTLFADKRVRKAMTLLTDRERISKDVFLGYATPAAGPFNRSSPQADPSIKPWPFDSAAAKKLLEEAGFKDRNGDGVIEDAAGKPFSFKLTYGSGNATFERVVLFLKDTYATAGVTLVPDPVDWPVLMKKLDNRDFDAITLAWGGAIESDLYQEFHSSQIADQGDNFMSYINPEFDHVVEQARSTVDDAKRMPLWHKAHAILHEDQPYTFLMSRRSLRFMDARIKNVRRSKIGLNVVYTFNMPVPWYVPKSMQKYTQ